MIIKRIVLTLAALAAITTAIVAAPTTADAAFGNFGKRTFGNGGGHFGRGNFGVTLRFGGDHRFTGNRISHWPRWNGAPSYRPRLAGYRPHDPVYVPSHQPSYKPVPTPAYKPVADNCLTKDHMEDGTVVFRDVCTGEEATMEQQPQEQPRVQPPRGPRVPGRFTRN